MSECPQLKIMRLETRATEQAAELSLLREALWKLTVKATRLELCDKEHTGSLLLSVISTGLPSDEEIEALAKAMQPAEERG